MPTRALILSYVSLWYALLEGRKLYELRRSGVDIPPGGLRVLFVCCKAVREREGLSHKMAVGFCNRRLGPFTAKHIISQPHLLGKVFATPDEICQLLPLRDGRPTTGFLYEMVGVKRSETVTWACPTSQPRFHRKERRTPTSEGRQGQQLKTRREDGATR